MGILYRFLPEEWLTLKMLKEDVELMRSRNSDGRFDIAINKQKSLFDYIKNSKRKEAA